MPKSTDPGVEIFSPEWYAITLGKEPIPIWIKLATQKICTNWMLGNSGDPALVAKAINDEFNDYYTKD